MPTRCKPIPASALSISAALALAGRAEEARPIAEQGLELEPEVRICELFDHILFHRGLMTKLMEGARLLGLPE